MEAALAELKKDPAWGRFYSAVWHITCADGPGDRELLRRFVQGPKPDSEIAYALATLEEPGALELFVQLVQKKESFECGSQVLGAGRILALGDPRGVPLFFEAFEKSTRPELCAGSASYAATGLATQAAKIENFDYVATVLALLEKYPKGFGHLVTELLARGAASEKWRSASCRALRTMKVEDLLSQLLVMEQTLRYCSGEKIDVEP